MRTFISALAIVAAAWTLSVGAQVGSSGIQTIPARSAYIGTTGQATGPLTVPVGTGSGLAGVGGALTTVITPVGNVGAGDDMLMSYTLPANSLSANGDALEIEATGTTAANGNFKEMKIRIFGFVIGSSGAVALNNGAWHIRCSVLRLTASSQEVSCTNVAGVNTSVASVRQTRDAITADLTAALTIAGVGTGVADNDVVQRGMTVKSIRPGS